MRSLLLDAENATLNFDEWHQGLEPEYRDAIGYQLSLSTDTEAEKRRIASSLWLSAQTGLRVADVTDNYEEVKARWAAEKQVPVDQWKDEATFQSTVRTHADDFRAQRKVAEDLARQARRVALWVPSLPIESRPILDDWKRAKKADKGYRPDKDGLYTASFTEQVRRERERLDPVLEIVNEAWNLLADKDGTFAASQVAAERKAEADRLGPLLPGTDLPEIDVPQEPPNRSDTLFRLAQRIAREPRAAQDTIIGALRDRAEMLPPAEKDAYVARWQEALGRGGDLLRRETLYRGPGRLLGGISENIEQGLNSLGIVPGLAKGVGDWGREQVRVAQVMGRLAKLSEEKILPNEGDNLLERIGLGAATSAAGMAAAVAATPFALYPMLEGQAYDELEENFARSGMSGDQADRAARSISPFAGAAMAALEYLTFGYSKGPTAVLQRKLIQTVAKSRPVTAFAAGLALETGEQFLQEVAQDTMPAFMADLAGMLGVQVPDQQVLDRLVQAASPETLGVSIVFALGGGGSMPGVEQARALQALGFTPEATDAVLAAQTDTARQQAFMQGILTATPPESGGVLEGEGARAVIDDAEANSAAGIVRVTRDASGWWLEHRDGSRTRTDTVEQVIALRDDLWQTKDEATAEQYTRMFDWMAADKKTSVFRDVGASLADDTGAFLQRPGEAPVMREMNPQAAQELQAELERLRASSEDPTLVAAMLGENVVRWKERIGEDAAAVVEAVTIGTYRGANITTPLHERFEARVNELILAGKLTWAEVAHAVRTLELATGKKYLKDATSETDVRETFMELMVADTVGRRKDGRRHRAGSLAREVRDATRKNPEQRHVLGKLGDFLRAVRAHVQAITQTAAAIIRARRAGKLNDTDAFTSLVDRILDLDSQAQFEDQVVTSLEDLINSGVSAPVNVDLTAFRNRDRGGFSLSARKAARRNSLRVLRTRKALTDAALSQESWRDWYAEHQETLDEFFGEDAALFQKILAITSQAASVKANVGLALKAYSLLKTGAPFDGKLRGEIKSGFLPAVIKNLEALRSESGIRGQKIQAYTSANEGDSSSVVVDRHISRILFGVDSPSKAQFAKAAKVLTEIADELGWEPRQVQAALWAWSIVKSGKTPQSYGSYLRQLHSRGTLKERIGAVAPGSSILHGDGGRRGGDPGRAGAETGSTEGLTGTDGSQLTTTFNLSPIDSDVFEHIYLRNERRFKKAVKEGRVRKGVNLDVFTGKALMLHQPDAAMSGNLIFRGKKVVEGKGGVYYPVLFGDQGDFWASTESAAKGMADALNEVSEANGGTIYLGLTSAPVDKLLSSTTMSTGVMDILLEVSKSPDIYGLSEARLGEIIVEASQTEIRKKVKGKPDKVVSFESPIKAGTPLPRAVKLMRDQLSPKNSSFDIRKAFVQSIARQLASSIGGKSEHAQRFASLLLGDKNLYAKEGIRKGKLSQAAIIQGLADLLTEPFLKPFQQLSKGGYLYAIIEMEGKVEAVANNNHASYPYSVRSTSGAKPTVSLIDHALSWNDVVGLRGKDGYIPENQLSSVYPPSNGVSSKKHGTLEVRAPRPGAERGLSINSFSLAKATQGIAFEKQSGSTQVATTVGSYKTALSKAATILGDEIDVLDYGAGLGLGADAMRAITAGKVDTLEVNPERWSSETPPTYTDSTQIDRKYDAVINLNVLNVVPRGIRDDIVRNIGDMLKDGGVAMIGVRKWDGDVNRAKNSEPAEEENSILITKRIDGKLQKVFQKGFSKEELISYLQDTLGEGFEVTPATNIGAVGAMVRKKQTTLTTGFSLTSRLDAVADALTNRRLDPKERLEMFGAAHEQVSGMARAMRHNDSLSTKSPWLEMAQGREAADLRRKHRADLDAFDEGAVMSAEEHEAKVERLKEEHEFDLEAAKADGWSADRRDALRQRQRVEMEKLKAQGTAARLRTAASIAKERAALVLSQSKETAAMQSKHRAEAVRQKGKLTAQEQHKEMLRALSVMDAILMQFPPAVRSKIGGFVKLASLTTTDAREAFLLNRIEKLDKVLEEWLRDEYDAQMRRILKLARAKGDAGEKMKGFDADTHKVFKSVEAAMDEARVDVDARLLAIDARIKSGLLTIDQEDLARLEHALVNLAGEWSEADATRRAAAVKAANDFYTDGRMRFKARMAVIKARRLAMSQALMLGANRLGTREERKTMLRRDESRTGFAKSIIQSLSGWEQVLHRAFGEGEVVDELVDRERAAAYQWEDRMQALSDDVQGLFTKLAGSPLDGEKLRYRMSTDTIDMGDGWGKFSELEAMQALLMWRQPDGKRHMEGHHIDQKWVDKLKKGLTPEGEKVMEFISDRYAEEYAILNPIYREAFGVDLPYNALYAPLTVNPQQTNGNQIVDPATGFAVNGSGTTPPALRTRSASAIAEPQFRDALQVLLAHRRQIEHWMAYQELARDMTSVLGNRNLLNSVEARAGSQISEQLPRWVSMFAEGGVRDAAANDRLTQFLKRFRGRFARMALVGRAGVLAIQSTQLAAAAAEIPADAYVKRFSKLMTGNLGWGDALRSSFIQRRIKQMPPIVAQAMEGLQSADPNVVKHSIQRIGELISGADGLFTAGTYAIILDYQRTLLREQGVPDADIDALAHKTAERITERVAQPMRLATRSYFENNLTSPLARMVWDFASEARQKIILAAWAIASKDKARAARAIFVTWVIGGLGAGIIRNIWRDARDEDDDEWFDEKHWGTRRLIAQTLAGPLNGVPLWGEAVEGVLGKLTGQPAFATDPLGMEQAYTAGKRMVTGKTWEDDDDIENTLRDVESIMRLIGSFSETAASATSGMHILRDAGQIIDNLVENLRRDDEAEDSSQ